MTYMRLLVLILTSVIAFALSLWLMSASTASLLQSGLRFAVGILAIFLPLTFSIRTKVEALPNIPNLKLKQVKKFVRPVVTSYISRIWTIWLLYTFTSLCWVSVSFVDFSNRSHYQIIAVSFCLALGWIVLMFLPNLYSMDVAVNALNVYMKEISLKQQEKEEALEQLSKELIFTEEQKDYFRSSLTPISVEKKRVRIHVPEKDR